MQGASVDVVWIQNSRSPQARATTSKLRQETRARVDGISFQVDIKNPTHRDVSELPLNGIGLVDLTFDEPLVLDPYQQNPVTGGLTSIRPPYQRHRRCWHGARRVTHRREQ
ncbi:elongation factor 1-alpha C-terminal domain-related protein [Shigella flexneri]